MTRSPDYDDKTDEGPAATARVQPGTPVLEPNEARGGMTHHNVRVVLGVSLVAIIVLFVIVYVAFFAGSAPPTVPPP